MPVTSSGRRPWPDLRVLAQEGYFFCRGCERVCVPVEHDYLPTRCNLCHSTRVHWEPPAWNDFPNTESPGEGQCSAVGRNLVAPKGLGTDGNKPLMRNRTACDWPSATGYTAEHILTAAFRRGR